MSRNKVFIELNEEIETAFVTTEYENVSKRLIKFLINQDERFTYNEETEKYFINSFYPSFPSSAWDRFIKAFVNIASNVKRVPVQADIVVTGKCHCRCWHCFRIKDKREDLSLVEIQDTLHSLYNMGTATVGITG